MIARMTKYLRVLGHMHLSDKWCIRCKRRMSMAEADLYGGYCSDCTLKWINDKDPYDFSRSAESYYNKKQ